MQSHSPGADHVSATARRGYSFWCRAVVVLTGALILLGTIGHFCLAPPNVPSTTENKPNGDAPETIAGRGTVREARFTPLSDTEAWACLPARLSGERVPLPAWARMLCRTLPRTTASMLELDNLHRSHSPLDPELRAQIRWVAAHANRCIYSQMYVLADLRKAGLYDAADGLATGELGGLSASRQAVLGFAHKLTTAPRTVTDAEVAQLIERHGEKQVVAMVLLLAYAQFQDRLLLALDVPIEPNGPLPSLNVRFSRRTPGFDSSPLARRLPAGPSVKSDTATLAPSGWTALDLSGLQCGLDAQRVRRARIRLPDKDRTANRWGLVGQTYQPDLATAWSACTQAFGEEADQDPIFEQSLFWVVTRTKKCFY